MPMSKEEQKETNNYEEYLNAHSEFMGLYLPVKFRLFGKYTTNCHPQFDLILCTEAYRKSLGRTLRLSYFDHVVSAS